MSTPERFIVVGVDQSPGADSALRWAVDEARVQRLRLRLVSAYRRDWSYGQLAPFAPVPPSDFDYDRAVAEQLVASAVDRTTELADDVKIDGKAVDGNPVPVLVDESTHATLVVLGSRHLATLGATMLGSIGAGVAGHAACPVVVVRGPTVDRGVHAAVVVGVDGAGGSRNVIEFGFRYASQHKVALRAVFCWRSDLLTLITGRSHPPELESAHRWLGEAMAGWREAYPDVETHNIVIEDHPVTGLVTESAGERLLVVGHRGRHARAGTLFGSVSQGVLHHADCRVAVVAVRGPVETGSRR